MHTLLSPSRGAKYFDRHVCLLAYLSTRPNLPYFLYTLPVTVDPSSSDGSAVRFFLLVLWMMSCYHIIEQMVVAMGIRHSK